MKTKTLPLTIFLGALITTVVTTSDAWSATIFTFDVNATTYAPDSVGNWQANGAAQFQVKVVVDETRFSTSSAIPPGSVLTANEDINMPMLSVSGGSADAISAVAATANLSSGFTSTSMAGYTQSSSNFLGDLQTLQFRSSVQDSYNLGDPYLQEGGAYQQVYNYSEVFSLQYDSFDDIVPQPLTLADFFSVSNSLIGVSDAFDFDHHALQLTDECLADFPSICATNFDLDALAVNGIRFDGSATLVSVSAVPLPMTGWLFGSALAALAAIGRRKITSGR